MAVKRRSGATRRGRGRGAGAGRDAERMRRDARLHKEGMAGGRKGAGAPEAPSGGCTLAAGQLYTILITKGKAGCDRVVGHFEPYEQRSPLRQGEGHSESS